MSTLPSSSQQSPTSGPDRPALGLRPTFYPTPGPGDGHLHPDRRPCPPWCEIGQAGDEHELEPKHLLSAEHVTEVIRTAASLYTGEMRAGGVAAATWETQMSVHGDSRHPRIVVGLRHFNGGRGQQVAPDRIRLSVSDAEDLVTVLQYLIGQAHAAAALQS